MFLQVGVLMEMRGGREYEFGVVSVSMTSSASLLGCFFASGTVHYFFVKTLGWLNTGV